MALSVPLSLAPYNFTVFETHFIVFETVFHSFCNGQQDGAVGKNTKPLPRGLFALEITPKLLYRRLELLHDVTDHYINLQNLCQRMSNLDLIGI